MIAGGQVVTPAGVVLGDLVLEDERVVAITQPDRFDGDRIDARGCFVLPGGVDPHVHMRTPGQEYKIEATVKFAQYMNVTSNGNPVKADKKDITGQNITNAKD